VSVTVDFDGYMGIQDAVAAGNMSSGAYIREDGKRPPPWETGPWAGRQEYLASEAIQLASVSSDLIRQIRPPVPIQLFPPETDFDRTPLTIDSALDTNRWSPKVRSWVSGSTQVPRRTDMQNDVWGGTMRNVSSTTNPMM
jgi:hypothetical protein